MNNKFSATANNGFTLIEVMVAVLLLATSYVAVLESFSSSMAKVAKIEKKWDNFHYQEQSLMGHMKYNNQGNEDILDGEVYEEGKSFILHKITSEDGLLVSLELSKK